MRVHVIMGVRMMLLKHENGLLKNTQVGMMTR
ncbi:hypothetical protein BJ964_006207 [Actinoplanes lobatus]|uniref:Uncharacterized protein n=1 Tax=Actinoplanes lobatus TaxID=113568 RepID=A0A7W7HK64_9ACTN|nr:hypothetical protein [Actinoplanes lobatus]